MTLIITAAEMLDRRNIVTFTGWLISKSIPIVFWSAMFYLAISFVFFNGYYMDVIAPIIIDIFKSAVSIIIGAVTWFIETVDWAKSLFS